MMTLRKFLEFSYRALKDNGRFIFYEPCYLIWQSGISAYFMSLDGGQNIRTEQQWKAASFRSAARHACFAPT